MKKLIISLAVTISLLLVGTSVFADVPIKVGIVDLEKIMQKSSQVASLSKELEKQFKPKQQALLIAGKSLQEEEEKLNRNAAVMTEGDRIKLQNKIIADRANLQSAHISFRQEAGTAQAKGTQQFRQKLRVVLADVAKKGGYTMIVAKQSLLYADDKFEITDAVLSALEKR